MTDEINLSPNGDTPSEPAAPADGLDLSKISLEALLNHPSVKKAIDDEAHKRAGTHRQSQIEEAVAKRVATELARRDQEAETTRYLNASDEQVGQAVKSQAKMQPILQKMRDDGVELGSRQTHEGYLNSLGNRAARLGVDKEFQGLRERRWSSFDDFIEAYEKLIVPRIAESDPALLDLIQKKKLAEARKLEQSPETSRPSGPAGKKMPKDMTDEEFDAHWASQYKTGKWSTQPTR